MESSPFLSVSRDSRFVVEFVHLFFLSEISSTLTFQLFRRPFLQPQFTNIFPTYPAPFLKYRLQLVQVLRFQKIFLG